MIWDAQILRVVLTGIPIAIMLWIGVNLSFSKTMTIKDDTPVRIVLAICTNRIIGAIFICAAIITAYI